MIRRNLWLLLLLAVILMGCTDNQNTKPNTQPASTSAPPINTDERPAVVSDPPVTSAEDIPTHTGGQQPVPPMPINPVIVQSAPETSRDTEAVLDEISRELDNLTEVLKEIETTDTAWDQEVSQP